MLIAFPTTQVSTLVKAPVSVFGARKTSPVVAVTEAVVKARRNLVAAAVGLPVPVAGHPGVAGAGAWRNVGCIRKRRLVETGAASSETYTDRDSGLGKHRASRQKHHCQQFRFHNVSFLPALCQCMARAESLSAMGCEECSFCEVFFTWCPRTRLVFLDRDEITKR